MERRTNLVSDKLNDVALLAFLRLKLALLETAGDHDPSALG